MDELRRYELYVIFQPELDDEQLEGRIDRINGYLTGNQGEIVEVARKGKRRLAYPINKFSQGIDVLYQVSLPSRRLEVLERQLNLNEDVMRYLVVRREELEKGERLVATPEQIAAEVASLQAQPTEIDLRDGAATDETETESPELPTIQDITLPPAESVAEEGEG